MAQSVYVENHGTETYTENFRGRDITIPSGGSVKMQRREAIAFLSTMSAPDPMNHNKPKIKKLRMEPEPKDKTPEVEEWVCNLDGRKFPSKELLEAHLEKLKDKRISKDDSGNIVKSKPKA